MSLILVAPSAQVLSAYHASLLDFQGPRGTEGELYHLPVGTLGLGELANGATLKDVKPSGCRFLAAWTDGGVTSCEMTQEDLYGNARFRNYVEGDAVMLPLERITQAGELPQAQTADYEVHYLSIPGIQFEGVHLVGQSGAGDLVLPVLSGDERLWGDVMDAGDFIRVAKGIAGERSGLASSALSS